MSKYIRTKDGRIYDLESKEISSIEYIDKNRAINEYKVECAFYTIYYYNGLKGHYLECDNKGGYSCDFIEEKDILKQADAIEELCDEFVSTYKAWEYPIITKVKQANIFYIKECAKRGEQVIYGAIWTDKGLIYVAKMNEKGELVLI